MGISRVFFFGNRVDMSVERGKNLLSRIAIPPEDSFNSHYFCMETGKARTAWAMVTISLRPPQSSGITWVPRVAGDEGDL